MHPAWAPAFIQGSRLPGFDRERRQMWAEHNCYRNTHEKTFAHLEAQAVWLKSQISSPRHPTGFLQDKPFSSPQILWGFSLFFQSLLLMKL